MHSTLARAAPLLFTLVVCLSPVRAVAADSKQVEKLVAEAQKAYAEERYTVSALLLQRAYSLVPASKLLYNLARAQEKAGRTDEAIKSYRAFLDAPDADPQLARKAAESYERLKKQQFEAEAAEREKAMAERMALVEARREADAQRARLEREQAAADEERRAQAAEIAEQQRQLDLRAVALSAEEAARKRRLAGWSFVGAGAAGAVVGGVFGGLALSAKSEFSSSLDPGKAALADSASSRALVADIAFAAAMACVVTGVVLLVTSPSASAPPEASPELSFAPNANGTGLMPLVSFSGRFDR